MPYTGSFREYTTAQRDALTGISTSTIIYNSTTDKTQIYDGTSWLNVGTTAPPAWQTAAGELADIYHRSRDDSNTLPATLSATHASSVTYAVTTGSIPGGLTLNANGTWSGTPNSVGSDTTSTFTVTATADGTTSDREFTIKIRSERTISEMTTFIFRNGRPDHMVGYHDDLLWALGMGLYVANTTFKEIEKNKNKSAAMIDSWMTNTSQNPHVQNTQPIEEKKQLASTTYATTDKRNPQFPDPMDPFRPMQNNVGPEIYKNYGWLFGNMGRRR